LPGRPRAGIVAGVRARKILLASLVLLLAACASVPKGPKRSPYDLVLLTVDGERFDLTQLHGKVAVVAFFATWCLPCMVEVPPFADLHRDFEAKGFSVVGIGMDLEGKKSLKPFVEAFKVPYPVLVADEEVREGRSPYERIEALPWTYVLDRDGHIAAAYDGPADPVALRALVEKLLRSSPYLPQ
jgi:peroxiredoxin